MPALMHGHLQSGLRGKMMLRFSLGNARKYVRLRLLLAASRYQNEGWMRVQGEMGRLRVR